MGERLSTEYVSQEWERLATQAERLGLGENEILSHLNFFRSRSHLEFEASVRKSEFLREMKALLSGKPDTFFVRALEELAEMSPEDVYSRSAAAFIIRKDPTGTVLFSLDWTGANSPIRTACLSDEQKEAIDMKNESAGKEEIILATFLTLRGNLTFEEKHGVLESLTG